MWDCQTWRLMLSVHSLGAGLAALIAVHLRSCSFNTQILKDIGPQNALSAAALIGMRSATAACSHT